MPVGQVCEHEHNTGENDVCSVCVNISTGEIEI